VVSEHSGKSQIHTHTPVGKDPTQPGLHALAHISLSAGRSID